MLPRQTDPIPSVLTSASNRAPTAFRRGVFYPPRLPGYDDHQEVDDMAEFIKVCQSGDIAPGEGRLVQAGGKRIALFNVDGTFHAVDDTCTHRGGPLSEGMLVGTEVTCPWHGAVFDVTSGSVLGPPAPKDVATYVVRVRGDEIEVEI
jgi:nitrite reductase/ring-hydroxylating ferredoxin subunit